MREILAIFIFITSLFFTGSVFANDFSSLRKTGVSIVTEVVNPLTIKLEDGRIIHLAGIDYPDLDFHDAGDLSVTAQKILEDFLVGKKVAIYQTKSKDRGRVNRMGHDIAHLVRVDDNIWTQALLLSLGVARVRTTKYNFEMAKQMLSIEDKARSSGSGMWSMDEYKILSPKQAEYHIGSYQIVEGVIKSVSMRKNKLYLNFGDNWRDDFTIAVSAIDLRRFMRRKIDLKQWNGKLIRVRGWIRFYNGPYVEVDHIAQFEPLFKQEQNNNVKVKAGK